MNNQWTEEPWKIVDGGFIVESSLAESIICQIWGKDEEEFSNSTCNAARIVQCVNALAGIKDPVADLTHLRSQAKRREEVEAIAKELLASVEQTLWSIKSCRAGDGDNRSWEQCCLDIEIITEGPVARATNILSPEAVKEKV